MGEEKNHLEYGGTFTKLFMQVEICSQQLEICKSVCMFFDPASIVVVPNLFVFGIA
jgi:hypothetical protein